MPGRFRHAVRVADRPLTRAFRRRLRAAGGQLRSDAGMSTAEYAVGTIAACGFAAVLYKVVTSSAVSSGMQHLIERALHAQF
ncbi:DUF4244 domain-containing protein [Streptomyces nanshensis]|uniref:DUF4244 domain-containing protein n=1 Tax=Streptomyces nanshensis TaxID=518642 RepID=A0A1E7JYU6_9ACTN|nr:DUF4244 domain-containing protein [Streptomyces nanshensis]OEU96785.1 hypothetical protein AN218_33935 [Streptomyces nanshensis]